MSDELLNEMQNHLISTNLPGVIRSPLDGTVVEKLINPGLLLQAGYDTLFHGGGSFDGLDHAKYF